MDIQHADLFSLPLPGMPGVGFHNVGSGGVLRASDEATLKYVQHYYGERCGHLPLNAEKIYTLVDFPDAAIRSQMAYLSALFGKTITPVTFDELERKKAEAPGQGPLVVPYINVPETETRLHNELGAESWGLPGKMTHVLKNKASFYQLLDEFSLEGFYPPDYTIANIYDVAREAEHFLWQVEELYKRTALAGAYPQGVMLRAAEEDGNYGCCLAYEHAGHIVVVLDGAADQARYYTRWQEALAQSQEHLASTMNVQKEARVVISRYIDFADSPGISVVIKENRVESLGWNSQLQKPGSKACIGTSTYIPKNAFMQRMQQSYEKQTATFFEAFLRRTARHCGINFASIHGVANLDIMIPGELEKRLQRKRGQPESNYLAECNPRWTNYTDAIMTVLGANRKPQTISNMKEVISAGISTLDKHPIPEKVNPQSVRACIAEKDEVLKQEGTRIICRMAKNPMGLIFAGDVARAQQAVDDILSELPLIR